MEEKIIKEIELREQGRTGELGNLAYIELLSLAYSMGIKLKPQSEDRGI